VKPLVELCKQYRLEAVFLVLERALFKLPVCPAKSANFVAPVALPHVEMKLVFFKAIKAIGDPAEGLNDPVVCKKHPGKACQSRDQDARQGNQALTVPRLAEALVSQGCGGAMLFSNASSMEFASSSRFYISSLCAQKSIMSLLPAECPSAA
jgi:hypothetical protein